MPSLRTTAQAFSAALKVGLIGPEEVIPWVDSLIEEDPQTPPYPLIEASLAGHDRNFLIEALQRFPGPLDPAKARRLLFGQMHRALLNDGRFAKPIAHHLLWMAVNRDVPNAEAEGWMFAFDDDLDLAEAGIFGSPQEVLAALRKFLAEFGDPV